MTRCRLKSAKTIISGTKYLAEHTFSFEKYVTALKAAFETLSECEEGMTANTQVYTLLKNTECTNSQVMPAVAAVRVSKTPQSSFSNSANTISKTVSLVLRLISLFSFFCIDDALQDHGADYLQATRQGSHQG